MIGTAWARIALNELIFLFSGSPYREIVYRPSPGPALLDVPRIYQEPGHIPADD